MNWILESALDRNADASHRLGTETRRSLVLTPARLTCPFCEATFDEDARRVEHIAFSHPVRPPVLSIGGSLMPSESTFRRILDVEEIGLANVTSAEIAVDGQSLRECGPQELPSLLAGSRAGVHRVKLVNRASDGATAAVLHTLRFEVPEPAELDEVDWEFERQLARDDVRMEDVVRFASSVAAATSAAAYADALAGYVTGVLIKDGDPSRGATLPFEEYRSRFTRALDVLAGFEERPLAYLVVCCIRMNLNDLARGFDTTGAPELDDVLAVLSQLALGVSKPDRPGSEEAAAGRAGCPVDGWTAELIERFPECWGDGGLTAAHRLAERASALTAAPVDMAKFRALGAAALIRAGDNAGARALLLDLQHDLVFGTWARTRLASDRE